MNPTSHLLQPTDTCNTWGDFLKNPLIKKAVKITLSTVVGDDKGKPKEDQHFTPAEIIDIQKNFNDLYFPQGSHSHDVLPAAMAKIENFIRTICKEEKNFKQFLDTVRRLVDRMPKKNKPTEAQVTVFMGMMEELRKWSQSDVGLTTGLPFTADIWTTLQAQEHCRKANPIGVPPISTEIGTQLGAAMTAPKDDILNVKKSLFDHKYSPENKRGESITAFDPHTLFDLEGYRSVQSEETGAHLMLPDGSLLINKEGDIIEKIKGTRKFNGNVYLHVEGKNMGSHYLNEGHDVLRVGLSDHTRIRITDFLDEESGTIEYCGVDYKKVKYMKEEPNGAQDSCYLNPEGCVLEIEGKVVNEIGVDVFSRDDGSFRRLRIGGVWSYVNQRGEVLLDSNGKVIQGTAPIYRGVGPHCFVFFEKENGSHTIFRRIDGKLVPFCDETGVAIASILDHYAIGDKEVLQVTDVKGNKFCMNLDVIWGTMKTESGKKITGVIPPQGLLPRWHFYTRNGKEIFKKRNIIFYSHKSVPESQQ